MANPTSREKLKCQILKNCNGYANLLPFQWILSHCEITGYVLAHELPIKGASMQQVNDNPGPLFNL